MLINSYNDILKILQEPSYKKYFLIGGSKMIDKSFPYINQYLDDVYVTNIGSQYLNKNIRNPIYLDLSHDSRYLHDTIFLDNQVHVHHYKYRNPELQYLDLIKNIIKNGSI